MVHRQRSIVNRASIGAVLVCICGAAPASAQSRPYRGLFGASGSERQQQQRLDLTGSIAQAYDSDAPTQLGLVDSSFLLPSGFSTIFMGSADYHYQRSRTSFGATGASAFRYYNELDRFRTVSHSAGIGFSARVASRTTLLVNQTAAYSPSYLYGLFPQGGEIAPGDAIPAAPDYTLNDAESYTYGTTVTLSHGVARRSSVSVSGDFQYTDFVHDTAARPDLRTSGVHGLLSRRFGRGAAFTLGYRYRTGDFGSAGGSTAEHGLDVGVDYKRRLSPTRNAVLGFNVGSSSLQLRGQASPLEASRGDFTSVTAQATAGYEFKSWQARATYRRGVEYVPQFTEPVFVDGVTAAMTGWFARRFELSAGAGYSSGEPGLTGQNLVFDTYTGTTRLRCAITRAAAAYVEYLYYYYDFSGSARLAPGLPAALERNAIRVGLTLWTAAVRK